MTIRDDLLDRFEEGWPKWIGCDEGWDQILTDLHAGIIALDPSYRIVQIKEKFGGLRFYLGREPAFADEINVLITNAETLSFVTCEICGEPGTLDDSHYWLKTLCEKHKAERIKRQEITG